MVLLRTKGLTKRFGALQAVDHVDIEVEKGIIYSIVGPNGAGKTTLFNLISGFLRPTEGTIEFRGEDITGYPPHKMSHLGMGRSFQIISLFSELTVLENVRLAVQARERGRFNVFKSASDMKAALEKAYTVLGMIGLSASVEHKAAELSHGDQRLLDIGVAMAADATLLLLDEPTSGLSPAESIKIAQTVQGLAEHLTVILIEHRIDMVLSISDRIAVLNYGQLVIEGTPEQVRGDEEIRRAYLGVR